MLPFSFFASVIKSKAYGQNKKSINQIYFDSKKVTKGSCFIGLSGKKYNGADFIKEVLEAGARGLIIEKSYKTKILPLIENSSTIWCFFVYNSKETLLSLGYAWRQKFKIPIVGITGSVGKTTTKELIASICQNVGIKICVSQKSYNGLIGLPISLLSIREYHTIGIFEVGIQKTDEMDQLIKLLGSLTWSIITTISESHIEYFKTLQNVIHEKIKIASITKSYVIIDYKYKNYLKSKNIISCGSNPKSDFSYKFEDKKLIITNKKKELTNTIKIFYHAGIAHCASLAYAFCSNLGIPENNIKKSIELFKMIPGRFSSHTLKNGCIIINDCYNSVTPEVMLTSLEAFKKLETEKEKIVILSDMLEQGNNTLKNHKKIIEIIEKKYQNNFKKVFFIGNSFFKYHYRNNKEIFSYKKSFEEVLDVLYTYCNDKHCILFKGSRGTKLYDYYLPKYILSQ